MVAGGRLGAITDVALASRGVALGDWVTSLVVGDHARSGIQAVLAGCR